MLCVSGVPALPTTWSPRFHTQALLKDEAQFDERRTVRFDLRDLMRDPLENDRVSHGEDGQWKCACQVWPSQKSGQWAGGAQTQRFAHTWM